MAKQSYAARQKMEKKAPKKFALKEKNPKTGETELKYPVYDKPHARNAKARAAQQYNKGNLTAAQKQTIDSKADKKLSNPNNTKLKQYKRMYKG